MRWVVVFSSSTAQPRVLAALAAYEHEALMPATTFVKHHRGGESRKAFSPLFTGYTFARIEPSKVAEILAIEGVRDVLRASNGKPVCVPDEAIEALRQAMRARLFDRTRTGSGLEVGAEVRVTEGPFARLVGKIASVSKRHRPLVLLKFLGRLTETEVPVDRLEEVK